MTSPVQADAPAPDTVTVTVGGNDIGYVTGLPAVAGMIGAEPTGSGAVP